MTTKFNIHRAHEDFDQARRKATWRDWVSLLTRKKNHLLSFNEIRQELPITGQHYLGFQMVPLNKIVGSEGRLHEFDRAFYPRTTYTKDRWLMIDQAHYDDVTLPPVELIKVGQGYFVRDGNHRVSVARARRHQVIDAYVTEIEVALENHCAEPDREYCAALAGPAVSRSWAIFSPNVLAHARSASSGLPGAMGAGWVENECSPMNAPAAMGVHPH